MCRGGTHRLLRNAGVTVQDASWPNRLVGIQHGYLKIPTCYDEASASLSAVPPTWRALLHRLGPSQGRLPRSRAPHDACDRHNRNRRDHHAAHRTAAHQLTPQYHAAYLRPPVPSCTTRSQPGASWSDKSATRRLANCRKNGARPTPGSPQIRRDACCSARTPTPCCAALADRLADVEK
jgi:hypothetical protein